MASVGMGRGVPSRRATFTVVATSSTITAVVTAAVSEEGECPSSSK